jgi:hypothetical protein
MSLWIDWKTAEGARLATCCDDEFGAIVEDHGLGRGDEDTEHLGIGEGRNINLVVLVVALIEIELSEIYLYSMALLIKEDGDRTDTKLIQNGSI